MADEIHVLLVEDNPGDARLVQELVAEGVQQWEGDGPTVEVEHVETLSAATDAVDPDRHGVVLLDLGLPDSVGMETLDRMLEAVETVPVVVLTGRSDDGLGIEAVRHGAQDFLTKGDLRPEAVVHTVRFAIERAKTKRELEHRTRELAIMNQLLRHDIRNDISLVVGRSQELSEYVDPRGEDLVAEVLTAANHVLQLTRTIGDTVEAVTRDRGRERHPVDPVAILETEVRKARRLYGQTAVEVAIDPVDEELRVLADELLAAVFGNLLSNALVYTAAAPEVRVSVTADADTVTVSVADNGPGIPDARKDQVFGAGEGGEEGGMGIGLYLVDQLVAGYEGDVWVEDNEPRGSVFHVELERAPEPEEGTDGDEEAVPTGATE